MTPVNSIRFKQHRIVYHRIHPKLFFGYRRYKADRSYIFVAEPEKALIDGYYFNRYTLEDLLSMSENLDFTKVQEKTLDYDRRGATKLKEALLLLTRRK